jgi:MinD-like ATPase involved in chromosome partitioning or flagellar assembly
VTVSTPPTDIPDEAWIDVVAAVGWDESNELWPVLQKAVAAALPIVLASRDSETADRLDEIARRLSDIAGPFAASAHPFASDVHGAIVSLRSVAASLRGEQ